MVVAVAVAVLVEAKGAARSARGTATYRPEGGARRTVLGRYSGSGQRVARTRTRTAERNDNLRNNFRVHRIEGSQLFYRLCIAMTSH